MVVLRMARARHARTTVTSDGEKSSAGRTGAKTEWAFGGGPTSASGGGRDGLLGAAAPGDAAADAAAAAAALAAGLTRRLGD